MTDEQLNFYDHLDWLKTIYVSRLDELNKKDKEISHLKSELKSLQDDFDTFRTDSRRTIENFRLKNVRCCEIETKNEVLEKEIAFLKDASDFASDLSDKYYAIPSWIRRIFVRE